MPSDFAKRLDDVIRHELLIMGTEYGDVIDSIEDSAVSGGAIVRMRPPYEDVEFEAPEPDLADDVFAARVGRRLKVVIEAPQRPPGQQD